MLAEKEKDGGGHNGRKDIRFHASYEEEKNRKIYISVSPFPSAE